MSIQVKEVENQAVMTKSIYRFGMICSFIVGLAYLAIGILLIIDPAESNVGDLEEFYRMLRSSPYIPITWRLIFVGVGFLTIPCITAISKLVRAKNREWEGFYQWVLILGYVGSVMLAVEWMREYFAIKAMVWFFPQDDRMYSVATQVASMPVDPDFLWKFGGLGLWYIMVNLLAYRKQITVNPLSIVGMSLGLCLIVAMIGGIFDTVLHIGELQLSLQQAAGFLAGFIIAPIYHIWIGLILKREANNFL